VATGGANPRQEKGSDATHQGGDRAKPAPRAASGTRPKRAASGTRAKSPAAKARTRKAGAEQTARSYFDAVAARDPDGMASHWSDEGVDDVVPFGVLRGPSEVRAFFADLFGALPDLETTVERVVADDRVASVQWRMRGTFSGAPFQGIDPTGRWVELRGVDVVEVEDGKIVRNTAYYDGMTFAREIGMLPPRDSQAERAMFAAFNAVTRVRERLAAR
jgi:steroid delta-isomerase-like uncharacterized protein